MSDTDTNNKRNIPHPQKKEPTLYSNILSGIFKSQTVIQDSILSTKNYFETCKNKIMSKTSDISTKKDYIKTKENLNILEKYSVCVKNHGEHHKKCIEIEEQVKNIFENNT